MTRSPDSSTDDARTGTLLLLAAGLAFGLFSEQAASGWDDPRRWLPDLAVGVAFLCAGAFSFRTERGTAALLVGVALSWWLGNLVVDARFLHRSLLLHTVATFPGWRTATPAGAALLAAGYLAAAAPAVARTEAGTAAYGVAVVLIALVRLTGSSGPGRRHRLAALRAALAIFAGTSVASLVRVLTEDTALVEPMLLWYQACLVAVALFLAAGLNRPQPGSIADVVVELSEGETGAGRDALASLLGDPQLEIGFPDGAGSYADARGVAVKLPGPGSARAATVVERDGVVAAVIVHDRSLLSDGALLEAVATVARLSAANATLNAETRTRLADLVDSRRRLLTAEDEERRRLAQRLRRGAGSRIDAVEQLLGTALAEATPGGAAARSVQRALQQLDATREDMSRIAEGLHPWGSGEDLAGLLRGLAATSPVPVDVTVSGPSVDDTEVAAAIYFVCSEAIANAVKHASATRISIALSAPPGGVMLLVSDDGVGGADPASGSGLRGLADRMAALGGTLTVESQPGSGTRLTATFPPGRPLDTSR